MLERYEYIKRQKGSSAAAELAKKIRVQFGDEPWDDQIEKESSQIHHSPHKPQLTETIITEVCDYFGLTREGLMTNTRKMEIVWPRQVAMFLIRETSAITLEEIGDIFGKDHSTVHYATSKVRYLTFGDSETSYDINELSVRIKQKIQKLTN